MIRKQNRPQKPKVPKLPRPSSDYHPPFQPHVVTERRVDKGYTPPFAPSFTVERESTEYDTQQRYLYLEKHPFCFFCLLEGFMRPSTVVHHLLRRLTHPELVNDPLNFVAICNYHHLVLHNQAGSMQEQQDLKEKERELVKERGLEND